MFGLFHSLCQVSVFASKSTSHLSQDLNIWKMKGRRRCLLCDFVAPAGCLRSTGNTGQRHTRASSPMADVDLFRLIEPVMQWMHDHMRYAAH